MESGVAARRAPLAVRGVGAAVTAIRPAEWIKNVLVFAGLVFSGTHDGTSVARCIVAFVAFCAVASAGYLFNDIRDVEHDRLHPLKSRRPIASGALNIHAARTLMVVLGAGGIAVAFADGWEVAGIVTGYFALTLAYTEWLKHEVILDVMALAGCFLLRVVAGTVAVDAAASHWLIVCTGMVALFMGFTKRRQEAAAELRVEGTVTRPVLEHYSLTFLDQMVSMVTAATVVTYTIYATDSPIAGSNLLWTVPMVVYAIFRYLYLIYHVNDPRPTSSLVVRDPGMLLSIIAWGVTAALVVYI
jgi:4-hydroxybenzoate polyprenyltransferase